MTIAVKTLEVLGFVDENGELHIDAPLDIPPARVRVSIMIEESDNGKMTSIGQVCDFYVKKAKRLEVVQEIALVGENEACSEIWTVTSTARMDFESRYPIYDIQSEIARATDRAIVGFRVINLQDFPYDNPVEILPDGSKSLWKREHAPAT